LRQHQRKSNIGTSAVGAADARNAAASPRKIFEAKFERNLANWGEI